MTVTIMASRVLVFVCMAIHAVVATEREYNCQIPSECPRKTQVCFLGFIQLKQMFIIKRDR